MATFGWVNEDAWERILTATERVPEPSGPRAPTFACPFCSSVLPSPTELQAHLAAAHRVAQPVMLLAGNEPASDIVLRRRLRTDEIAVANATAARISVDGSPLKSVTPAQLGHIVAATDVGDVSVILENASEKRTAPVTRGYRIAIRLARPEMLQAVDLAFDERLNTECPSIAMVVAFLADERCQGPAADYATGLAEYVLGLIVKECPHGQDISSPLERYREHFGSALLKLTPHRRPLSGLLSAVMRFSLNDFSGAGIETGHFSLDAATEFLRGPKLPPTSWSTQKTGPKRRVCPIDHGTETILALSDQLSAAGRWSPVLADRCRQVASGETLDLMDQQKALALWALTALRYGAKQEAFEPLTRIAATYPFDSWASDCLEMLSQ